MIIEKTSKTETINNSDARSINITWTNMKLNLSINDKKIVETCKTCEFFKSFYIIGIDCDMRSIINKNELASDVLIDESGNFKCGFYSKKKGLVGEGMSLKDEL